MSRYEQIYVFYEVSDKGVRYFTIRWLTYKHYEDNSK